MVKHYFAPLCSTDVASNDGPRKSDAIAMNQFVLPTNAVTVQSLQSTLQIAEGLSEDAMTGGLGRHSLTVDFAATSIDLESFSWYEISA
jgi:hypothetical protein